jgi:transposase
MATTRQQFTQKGFDEKEYDRYFHLHQAEYIRKKLRVIKSYHENQKPKQIASQQAVHMQSIHKYVNTYLLGGFALLCQATVRRRESFLSQEQSLAFKEVILTKRPFEVGLEGNIWTGKLLCEYLQKTYGVSYKSGIYDLLNRLNLSHQRAHADYGNAK